jgi:hypothetical protein
MTDSNQTGHTAGMPSRPKRPLPLKLIFWIFTLWSLLGWLRFARALGERDLIMSLVGPVLNGYLLLAGLAWGLLALPVLWGLLSRAIWTPTVLQVTAVLYPLLYWLERLLLWQDPNAHRNWPLMLLLTIAWGGLVVWGLRSAQNSEFLTQKQIPKRGNNEGSGT